MPSMRVAEETRFSFLCALQLIGHCFEGWAQRCLVGHPIFWGTIFPVSGVKNEGASVVTNRKNAGVPLTHYFFKQIIDIKNLIDIVLCMEKALVFSMRGKSNCQFQPHLYSISPVFPIVFLIRETRIPRLCNARLFSIPCI